MKADSKSLTPNGLPSFSLTALTLILFGLITVITPKFRTFDTNGVKFLSLAVYNTFVFIYLLSVKKFRFSERSAMLFRSNVFLAYAVFILIALISFLFAYNVKESLLHYAKVLTPFIAAILTSILIIHDRGIFRWLAIAMALLLIIDGLTVLKGIMDYAQGSLRSTILIKSVYSNKNILASSIFVKIPFALWLIFYEKRLLRITGYVAVGLAVMGVFFLTARAFMLGLIFLAGLVAIFSIIRYVQNRDRAWLYQLGYVLLTIVASAFLFSVIQKTALSDKRSDLGIGSQMGSIAGDDGGGRLDKWERTVHLIQKHPLTGVGLGNWKIESLAEENLLSDDYIYAYKSHNDFLEITSETGIFGGLAFLAIFVLAAFNAFKVIVTDKREDLVPVAMVSVLGLAAYAVDAFFNFPQDRPEIQALFALFAGTGIALPLLAMNAEPSGTAASWKKYIIPAFTGLALVYSIWLLTMNFKSLRLQRIIKTEQNGGKLTSPASRFDAFPSIPDINVVGEPINVLKARYLIEEERFNEAISLLKSDRSNPNEGRVPLFTGIAYSKLKNYDSAEYYINKVLAMKPLDYPARYQMDLIMKSTGRKDQTPALWTDYVEKIKKNQNAWVMAITTVYQAGDTLRASQLTDEALTNLSGNDAIKKLRIFIDERMPEKTRTAPPPVAVETRESAAASTVGSPAQTVFLQAIEMMQSNRIDEAIQLFSSVIIIDPGYMDAYENRAVCHFMKQDFKRSISDFIQVYTTRKKLTLQNYNLLGSAYYKLNDLDEACRYFKIGAEQGDPEGASNYAKVCGGR